VSNPQAIRKSFWASGGSVLAAAIASACCWLPLLLIVAGASAVGVSALFEQVRPWFLAASAVLLVVGFYLNYFRREKCEDGEACATPNRKLQRTSRVMLWIATVGVLAFALFPNYVGALIGRQAGDDDALSTQVTLTVEGMTCGGCAVTVEQALLKVPGVVSANVSYEESRAVVTLDSAAPASTNNLIAAVSWTGYTATLKPPNGRSE
jgi:copper chaperone CopZ